MSVILSGSRIKVRKDKAEREKMTKKTKSNEKKRKYKDKRMCGWHVNSGMLNGEVTQKWFVVDNGNGWDDY